MQQTLKNQPEFLFGQTLKNPDFMGQTIRGSNAMIANEDDDELIDTVISQTNQTRKMT